MPVCDLEILVSCDQTNDASVDSPPNRYIIVFLRVRILV